MRLGNVWIWENMMIDTWNMWTEPKIDQCFDGGVAGCEHTCLLITVYMCWPSMIMPAWSQWINQRVSWVTCLNTLGQFWTMIPCQSIHAFKFKSFTVRIDPWSAQLICAEPLSNDGAAAAESNECRKIGAPQGPFARWVEAPNFQILSTYTSGNTMIIWYTTKVQQ